MSEISQGGGAEARERTLVSAPEVSWALRDMLRAAGELDVELARRLHLRLMDNLALGHVMDSDDDLGPAELSARLGISTGSGSELVDRLERMGHLERHRDPVDRRRVSLRASPSAVQSVVGELGPLLAAMDALAGEFTEAEQQVIAAYLRAAGERVRGFVADRPPTH